MGPVMDDSSMSPLPMRQRPTIPSVASTGLEKAGVKRVAPIEVSAGQAGDTNALTNDNWL